MAISLWYLTMCHCTGTRGMSWTTILRPGLAYVISLSYMFISDRILLGTCFVMFSAILLLIWCSLVFNFNLLLPVCRPSPYHMGQVYYRLTLRPIVNTVHICTLTARLKHFSGVSNPKSTIPFLNFYWVMQREPLRICNNIAIILKS